MGDVELDGQGRHSHLVLPGSTVRFTWLVNPVSILSLYHISYILAMPSLPERIFSTLRGNQPSPISGAFPFPRNIRNIEMTLLNACE